MAGALDGEPQTIAPDSRCKWPVLLEQAPDRCPRQCTKRLPVQTAGAQQIKPQTLAPNHSLGDNTTMASYAGRCSIDVIPDRQKIRKTRMKNKRHNEKKMDGEQEFLTMRRLRMMLSNMFPLILLMYHKYL